MGTDQFFTELGRSVLARWKKVNFSLARFPDIAQTALEENTPSSNVDVSTLVRDFLLDDEQPFQTQSGFGEPELVVYDNPRFYIQILFWLEGTTDIHQHKFSGAFHVLKGSSLHSSYEFDNVQPISAHLRVGDLRLKDTQLLQTGSTIPIVSGSGHIHSLFHLDTPSLTVVIRTHTDPGTGPQFTYLPPHLAVDPFHQDTLTNRRKQLLDVLEKTGDASYVELVTEMIRALDFERGFFILQNGMGYLRSLDQWEEVWRVFEERHQSLASYVASSLDEILRRDTLVAHRYSVIDVEHRYFIALLLTVSRREDILAFTLQRIPGDPISTIVRWANELCATSDEGTWILDAEFPRALDIPLEDQPQVMVATLAQFMRGNAGPLKGGSYSLSSAETEELRRCFQCSSFSQLIAPGGGPAAAKKLRAKVT